MLVLCSVNKKRKLVGISISCIKGQIQIEGETQGWEDMEGKGKDIFLSLCSCNILHKTSSYRY